MRNEHLKVSHAKVTIHISTHLDSLVGLSPSPAIIWKGPGNNINFSVGIAFYLELVARLAVRLRLGLGFKPISKNSWRWKVCRVLRPRCLKFVSFLNITRYQILPYYHFQQTHLLFYSRYGLLISVSLPFSHHPPNFAPPPPPDTRLDLRLTNPTRAQGVFFHSTPSSEQCSSKAPLRQLHQHNQNSKDSVGYWSS